MSATSRFPRDKVVTFLRFSLIHFSDGVLGRTVKNPATPGGKIRGRNPNSKLVAPISSKASIIKIACPRSKIRDSKAWRKNLS